MSPNGRRAWRRAAKKLRRKMGRKWHCSTHDRNHITGAWFKRHGFTDQGIRTLDDECLIRTYIGLWGTVNGDGVEFVVKPKPFTARSLVGMPQGARKRRWAKDYDALPQSGRASKTVSMLRAYGVYLKDGNPLAQRLRPCPGCCACWGCEQDPTRINPLSGNTLHWAGSARKHTFECPMGPPFAGKSKQQIARMRKWQDTLPNDCDGSGVLSARKANAQAQ